MRRVWLIRHCRPDIPEGVRMCLGRTDLPLGDTGHLQAAELSKSLPLRTLDRVFSSHLQRSLQTARYLSPAPIILPGLEELDAGAWDGLTFAEIRLQYPALYEVRGKDPTIPPPGSEPNDRGLARFQAAMEQAAAMTAGDFAVVSHGGIISLFLESLGMPRYKPTYGQAIPLLLEQGRYIPHHTAHKEELP